jgi:protein-disulfide isomerase
MSTKTHLPKAAGHIRQQPPSRPGSPRRPGPARVQRRSRTVHLSWWITMAAVVLAAVVGVVIQSNRSANAAAGAAPHHLLGPGDSEVEGSPTAPVLVEEYGDYQCPVCGRFHAQVGPTIDALVRAGSIRFAFHPFAFIGPESITAAAAAECAGDDGHYFAMSSELYDNQFPENSGRLTTAELLTLAHQAGVTSPTAMSCIRSGTYKGWVRKVTDEGSRRGVTATPTIFVNGSVLMDPTVQALTAAVQAAAKV